MKQVFLGIVVILSAFGQEPPLPDFAKLVVPVVVQINGTFVRSTGIQVGPESVVVPRLLLLPPTSLRQGVFVGTKLATNRNDLVNGMICLTVPGLRPDAPILKVVKPNLAEGPVPVFFVGYNLRGELIVQNASIALKAGEIKLDLPLDGLDHLGLGWGLFTTDGDILSVITALVRAPNPGGGFSSHVELQPAKPIMAAVESMLGAVTEKF